MSLLSVTQKIKRQRTERCDVITLLWSDHSVTIDACAYLLTIPVRCKGKRQEGEREERDRDKASSTSNKLSSLLWPQLQLRHVYYLGIMKPVQNVHISESDWSPYCHKPWSNIRESKHYH
jgi:hypothetical protein